MNNTKMTLSIDDFNHQYCQLHTLATCNCLNTIDNSVISGMTIIHFQLQLYSQPAGICTTLSITAR